MAYCENYDIGCPYALHENAPVPCIGSQLQCNKYRKATSEKTRGQMWRVIDHGVFKEIIHGEKGKEPNRTQWE